MHDNPSYRPSTTIEIDPDGWRVTRKGDDDDRFKLYGRFASLGEVAAMIRNANRACTSRWKVEGVEVPGDADALTIAKLLDRKGNPSMTNDLVLCRSDTGDGGWSLHAPGSTDEDIATGDAPVLLSGPAEHTDDGWSRPNEEDYRAARRAWALLVP